MVNSPKFIRCGVFLAVLASVGACNDTVEITSETVSPRMLRQIPEGQHLGWVASEIRTFEESADGKKTEIVGASCVVKSKDFMAKVTSPARIKTPTYVQGSRFADRGKPSQLSVKCSGHGLSGDTIVEALPYGLRDSTTTTSYYYSGTGSYAGGFSTTKHYGQLSSSYPWSYGGSIKLVMK